MKMRNIVLQALSALVMSSAVCASPAELPTADVQAFMEAKKQKLVEKMVAAINNDIASIVDMSGSVAPYVGLIEKIERKYNVRVKEMAQFYIFKYFYDEYRSHFPQSDAQVDQTLRNILDMRMREKLLEIMHLEKKLEIKTQQQEKGFIRNIRSEAMYVSCGLAAVGYAFFKLCNSMQPDEKAFLCILFGAGSTVSFRAALDGYDDLGREIKYLTYLIESCKVDVAQLDQAYAYAFPGEQKLSDQVKGFFQQIQEIEALYKSAPE